jgi:hypothetical protein
LDKFLIKKRKNDNDDEKTANETEKVNPDGTSKPSTSGTSNKKYKCNRQYIDDYLKFGFHVDWRRKSTYSCLCNLRRKIIKQCNGSK